MIKVDIRNNGFSIAPSKFYSIINGLKNDLSLITNSYNDLPQDIYMPKGKEYRSRRYGRFCHIPKASMIYPLPQTYFFQTKTINDFAGGVRRLFDSLDDNWYETNILQNIILNSFNCLPISSEEYVDPWHIGVHAIRISTTDNMFGNPTPEGIHTDGHQYLCIILISRTNITGGESTITSSLGEVIFRGCLHNPLDTIFLTDYKMLHSVSEIIPIDSAKPAYRDVLILDFDPYQR